MGTFGSGTFGGAPVQETGPLRFRYRHLHATMADYIRDALLSLNWGDASLDPTDPANAAINFGGTPVTYVAYQPLIEGQPIVENMVCITLGDEPHAADQEIGDGLKAIDIPLFIDIYGTNRSISESIASDLKDLLEDAYVPLLDYAQQPPAMTGETIELDKDDILIQQPQAALDATDVKKQWRVVKTIARVYYTKSPQITVP